MWYPFLWDVMHCHISQQRIPHVFGLSLSGIIPMFDETEIKVSRILLKKK
jgi:hypothetical protein